MYWPGPYDEILGLCERCHVTERWLDEAVGWVTQEVPVQAGLGDGDSSGREANLGGVWGQVVGGIKVEVRDVPEPAWKKSVVWGTRLPLNICVQICTFRDVKTSILFKTNIY